jgi:hypothetical protein
MSSLKELYAEMKLVKEATQIGISASAQRLINIADSVNFAIEVQLNHLNHLETMLRNETYTLHDKQIETIMTLYRLYTAYACLHPRMALDLDKVSSLYHGMIPSTPGELSKNEKQNEEPLPVAPGGPQPLPPPPSKDLLVISGLDLPPGLRNQTPQKMIEKDDGLLQLKPPSAPPPIMDLKTDTISNRVIFSQACMGPHSLGGCSVQYRNSRYPHLDLHLVDGKAKGSFSMPSQLEIVFSGPLPPKEEVLSLTAKIDPEAQAATQWNFTHFVPHVGAIERVWDDFKTTTEESKTTFASVYKKVAHHLIEIREDVPKKKQDWLLLRIRYAASYLVENDRDTAELYSRGLFLAMASSHNE